MVQGSLRHVRSGSLGIVLHFGAIACRLSGGCHMDRWLVPICGAQEAICTQVQLFIGTSQAAFRKVKSVVLMMHFLPFRKVPLAKEDTAH